MNDYIRSLIRTAVPAALGIAASWLVVALVRSIGFELDGRIALGIVTAAAITLVYGLGRALERSSVPLLAWLGRLLLTLGPDIGKPAYVKDDDITASTSKHPAWRQ